MKHSKVKTNVKHSLVTYLLFIITSFFTLIIFNFNATLSIILSQVVICVFFVSILRTKLAFVILLFPVISFLISEGYTDSFTTLGDGKPYVGVSEQFQEEYLNNTDNFITEIKEKSTVRNIFYFHYLGTLPTILLPKYIFSQPLEETEYYLFQQYVFLFLMSLLFYLSTYWKIFTFSTLQIIFIFLLVSPTFFELGSAITRHYLTFFSVFLFYISYHGLINNKSIFKFITSLISILLIFLGKPGYLILLILYVIILNLKNITKTKLYIIVGSLALLLVYLEPIIKIISGYLIRTSVSTNSVSFGNGLFFSLPLKLIAAILSPFPWYKFYMFSHIYGDNFLLFIFHIFSSLFGLWIFMRLFIYNKKLFRISEELRSLLIFGLVMSTSIFAGQIGFHGYLSIFFPFFAPLILIKKYNISLIFPVMIAFGLNIVMLILF